MNRVLAAKDAALFAAGLRLPVEHCRDGVMIRGEEVALAGTVDLCSKDPEMAGDQNPVNGCHFLLVPIGMKGGLIFPLWLDLP